MHKFIAATLFIAIATGSFAIVDHNTHAAAGGNSAKAGSSDGARGTGRDGSKSGTHHGGGTASHNASGGSNKGSKSGAGNAGTAARPGVQSTVLNAPHQARFPNRQAKKNPATFPQPGYKGTVRSEGSHEGVEAFASGTSCRLHQR